jgi:hypothetical protein
VIVIILHFLYSTGCSAREVPCSEAEDADNAVLLSTCQLSAETRRDETRRDEEEWHDIRQPAGFSYGMDFSTASQISARMNTEMLAGPGKTPMRGSAPDLEVLS